MEPVMALYDELKSRLDFIEDPAWDTADVIERGLIATSEITAAGLVIYQRLRGNAVEQAELSAAIRRLHDEHIAPLDIPGVGPFIEAVLDGQLGGILGGAVPAIDAALDKVLPNEAE